MSWEYIRVQVEIHKIVSSDAQIAAMGREGWELVCAVDAANQYLHMWFKRPAGGR